MDSYLKEILEIQRRLSAHLHSDRLPEALLREVAGFMGVENVLLVNVDGKLLGPWAEQTSGWNVKSYSLEVIRKAIESDQGYSRGGTSEGNPSDSQIAENILSCLAARVEAGGTVVAAVYCDIRMGNRRFTDMDGIRLKTVADVCAVYVTYLNLYNQSVVTDEVDGDFDLDRMFVGVSPAIQELKSEIRDLAPVDTSVLISGETGTGKEVLAQALHTLSSRGRKALAVVHCAAINEGVFESELFGHERGAFSGAHKRREGKILQANGGTLFLDEVGEIPAEFQTKLLRVLETKKLSPVGSDLELSVDFRLVSATNRDLKSMVASKTFRDDLHYRISDVHLRIPPLRERLEDVPILARHFANPKHLTDDAIHLLEEVREWPGNVRQLKKIVENACKMVQGYVVSESAIGRQLRYQELQPIDPSESGPAQNQTSIAPPPADSGKRTISYQSLRQEWQDGALGAVELERILNSLYVKVRHSWGRVGKQLGISSNEEMRSFRNWVYYLQKNKTIRPPENQ